MAERRNSHRLVDIDWEPNPIKLRQFGWTLAILPAVIGWLVGGTNAVIAFAAALGLFIGLTAGVRPGWIRPIYLAVSLITLPIGIVVAELTLLAIFLLVFTPVALFFRLIGRDALQRRFEPDRASYWESKAQPSDVRQYFRQS